jgi:hypothetical protein
VAALVFSGPPAILAQHSAPGGAPGVPNLRSMIEKSGYIFSGTVLRIQPRPARDASTAATVSVTFRVDRAVRGVRNGEHLTIEEWAGLWQGGERYHAGERVFLFLYPPSRLGLTSPIGGWAGRIRVSETSQVELSAAQSAAWSGEAAFPGGMERHAAVHDFARCIRRMMKE